MIVAWFLLGWFVLSVIIGVVVGHVIRIGGSR